MVRETRHLWVGNLPENVREEKIVEHFKRYGRVESVKVLPKRGSEGGVAAFVDFVDIKSAQKAHNAVNKMGDRDLRTDYNEPGTIPSAARALDDSLSLGSRGRDVSGFTRTSGGSVYGPPTSLHSRDGRYERRLDGTAESRDRTYDHSTYGHHERSGSSFERQRHYEADFYRSSGSSSGGTVGSSGVAGTVGSGATGASGTGASTGCITGANAGSTSSVVAFYRSHSRSPCRFETAENRYESRAREAFTLASVVHRDLYREERVRRGERSYRHSRSRSPHSAHSRNPSPQRLPQASRAPCSRSGSRSRSRSSSSDSVSSTSSSTSGSDSSSSSSDESPARSVQSAAVPAHSALLSSLDKDEPRKSFGIKVQNLPVRSTDTSLKDGLFHEFKKHGKVTSVQIHGASEERYGLVFFRQQEDQEKALAASKGKLFFGMQIDVTAWNGPETESENEFRPLDERIDEFHPKATRTLFIGNLEKTTTYHDLLNIFQRFGEIVDIDIKKVNGAPQYAFLQYCDIASVCKAIKKMDGEYLGNNRLKLGFGKSMPTTCVWLDGLASNTTEQFLTRHFCRYGHVVKVVFDRMKGMALILYNNIEYAQAAVKDTKGWKIGGSKIKVDFANQESQMAFYRSMQASGQDIRDVYDIISERRDDRRAQYEFQAERQYYENVRTSRTYTDDSSRKYATRSREFYAEWDPYQGDYYETQYFEDPREYRDYRADPYEQDIRKYSYLQRERERERERFETDRGRDHTRRTIERSQSPSHITSRRPASPATSPPILERIPGDSDRRACCRSSERSGSCSSISPPRFEKLEKTRPERYSKSEKADKEKVFETERGSLVDKEKRVHKERGEKEKRLKKSKNGPQGLQVCETKTDLDSDTSTNSSLRNNFFKICKENTSKGRLDLLPCVVQLTRVKEKEGKLLSYTVEKCKDMSNSPQLASPLSEQRSPLFHSESSKGNIPKQCKQRDGSLQIVDRDLKNKPKKQGKSEMGFDVVIAPDVDRLAARKRRFEDTSPLDKLKKTREDDSSDSRHHKACSKEIEADIKTYKRENHKDRCVQPFSKSSPQNRDDHDGLMTLESQSREQCKNPLRQKDTGEELKCEFPAKLSNDCLVMNELKEQKYQLPENEHVGGKWGDWDVGEDSSSDQTNLSNKQTEQIQWFMQKLTESERLGKLSRQFLPYINKEKDCFLSNSGITSQQKNEDENSMHEQNKSDHFEFTVEKKNVDLPFECSQKQNEDSFITSPAESCQFSSSAKEETSQKTIAALNTERKSPSENQFLTTELKNRFHLPSKHLSSTDPELSKLKTTMLSCDEELMQHWKQSFKSETEGPKQKGIQKQDLEPGEVQSDSDEEFDTKHFSPSSNNSLSFILRERDETMTDVKLTTSLEKNKFYSFALDKTITPDTKALLERAKTLYSTREDNWSFLPSRFPTSHSCSVKNKEELAPRPIPSWYMKKKKIRTDSVEKMSSKNEELKSQDPERQELYASRFLHSSIFEQDSRRLQHLERKNQDVEPGVCKTSKPDIAKVQRKVATVDTTQEPIVLFHSRFLELQQQKDKDNSPTENETLLADVKKDEIHNDPEKVLEAAITAEDQSSSPQLTLTLCTSVPLNDEPTLPTIETSDTGKSLKIENRNLEASPSVLLQELKQPAPKVTLTPLPVNCEVHSDSDKKLKEAIKEREHSSAEETLEERSVTLGAEKKTTEMDSSESNDKKTETVRNDQKKDQINVELDKQETRNIQSPEINEESHEECVPEEVTEVKPVKSRRQSKNKRSKKLSMMRASKASHTASNKQATRKSERIDKEKLKRAEMPKPAEIKSTTKSPTPTSDSEQKAESSLITGRTRRRNVRSVYATLREAGEEIVQSSRLTRKRAAFKDAPQDNPLPVSRRGRPPKRGIKRGDGTSPTKMDQTIVNPEVKETIVEALVTTEGWRPRSQRVNSSPNAAADKKTFKTEVLKRSGTKTISIEEMDEENERKESKTNGPETIEKPTDKEENATALPCKKEKHSGGPKMEETDAQHNSTLPEKPPEKSAKTKTAWVKRNLKLEERSHNLKNLEIRVSVDDVKSLLRSEENERDPFHNSVLKTKKSEPQIMNIENPIIFLENQEEMLADSDQTADPTAVLLAQQKELEQAVENIAKLTVEQPSRPYKEPATATPTILPPVNVEPEEPEEEKRANPASETELAAAIDSITTEVSSADGEGFTGSSTYPPAVPSSTSSAPAPSVIEPERRTVVSNVIADTGCLTPSQDVPLHETCKKTSKVQTKSPKKPRGRRTTKKEDVSDSALDLQSSPSKLPESIPEDPETINPKGITITAGTSAPATVVTAVATCRRDVISSITVETPKEAEQPEVEQPVPKESACHSGTFHVSTFKKHPLMTEQSIPKPTVPQDADMQPTPQHKVSQKIGKISQWAPKSEESRIYVAPPCHVTVVTPSLPSAALGNTSANPPLPPDTKASDVDPSSSTLRKILMEPKYVSASSTSAIAINTTVTTTINSTIVTPTLSDSLRMSEKPALYAEERLAPFQPIHRKPSPLTESHQNYRDRPHNAAIPSPTTSVISRIPLPYDTEETPRISLSGRNISQTIPRQKQRFNSNENTRCNNMGMEEGKRGRLPGDVTSSSTASVPGLRVNTSEGVVVLSYSGQKTEGPQRMRAKISQIPQATVVDVEFQQSLSKSHLKQETCQSSPNILSSALAYRHPGGQVYNPQNVITTTKQHSLDKSEAPYHSSQGGVVKMFQQPGPPQVLAYNQPVIHQHSKRALISESPTKKIDSTKGIQAPHPPLSGTCMSPSPGIPIDRSVLQGNQEPQSPRSTVKSPPPYHKTCSISNSPIGTSAVLSHTVSTYPTIHHTHLEQSSVIIQPHSGTPSRAHNVQVDNRSLSGISYGKQSDSISSSNTGPLQQSSIQPSNVIHNIVPQSHSSPKRSGLSAEISCINEKDSRHFNQATNRRSVSQPQNDVTILHSELSAMHSRGNMDQYRDMHQRVHLHQQLGEQVSTDVRQLCNTESTLSSNHISQPLKTAVVSKGIDFTTKGHVKTLEGKLIQSPPSESRIRGVQVSSPVFSNSHGVKVIQPATPGSFPVYQDIQGFPTQFSGHLPSYPKLATSQVPLEAGGHRSKTSHPLGGGNDNKPETSYLLHATTTDYAHISRIPRDTISPSYQSPMSSPITSPVGFNNKQEASVVKRQTLVQTSSPASVQQQQAPKQGLTGHRSFDMMQLLTKYPIVWQGLLALKNDQAAVQLHFVSGNTLLAQRSLPPPEGGPLLRIVQRMRLEASQLDSVARRMTVENDYCLLLALPCGRDQEDVLGQTHALKSGFITYLQAKQAAGIINVPNPGSNQPAYVVQIFPPCEFSESHLSCLAPDLLNSISSISPHLMIVIASV